MSTTDAKRRSRTEWKGSLQNGGGTDSPTELLLSMQSVVGRKWHPVVMHRLIADGPLGFNELQKSIDDVSAKMLSDSLEDLEEMGLVDRSIVSEKPFRVAYSVTEMGQKLDPLIEEMLSWSREHPV